MDSKRLKFMVEVMGARVLKLHEAWHFRCEPFLRRWMQACYEARLELKRQGRTIGAKMLKLVMNSIYGKLVQNMENYSNTSVYTDVHAFPRFKSRRQRKAGASWASCTVSSRRRSCSAARCRWAGACWSCRAS